MRSKGNVRQAAAKARELMRNCRLKQTKKPSPDDSIKVISKTIRKSNKRKLAARKKQEKWIKRQSPEYRRAEIERNKEAVKITKISKEYKLSQRKSDLKYRRKARGNEGRRSSERTEDAKSRRIARGHPEVRKTEQERDTSRRRKVRADNNGTCIENQINALRRKILRTSDSEKRRKEKAVDKARKVLKRKSGPEIEKSKLQDSERKKRARKSSVFRKRENAQRSILQEEKQNISLSQRLEMFVKAVKNGPTFTCSCCGGLWFRSSVFSTFREKLLKIHDAEFVSKVLFVIRDSPWFCRTCYQTVNLRKIPRLALCNGLDFPTIPDVLKDLTSLEERLIALRLPFLQIRTLGVDRQCGLKGNVVHIANELDASVAVIPRCEDESKVIPVILVRDMTHEKPYLFQNIRPAKVYEAAAYLLTTPLYKQEGATLSETWLKNNSVKNEVEASSQSPDQIENSQEQHNDQSETMLFKYGSEAIKLAPGQGKKPLSLIMDENAEEASYPTIYGGQKRKITSKISVHDVWKSETRRYDRRCAVPHKVLHAYKLAQNHQVASSISVCLRKRKGKHATASELLDQGYLSNFINHDSGFRILKDVRTSPSYWECKTKHIFAMIRQLGIPNLFITLSAAEAHWPELLVILKNVLDNETLTEEEVTALPYEVKADLIRRDPVTCSRYFDFRLRTAFNLLFKPAHGIFGANTMKDFYWRIEFQHRGSPHVHMLVWLNDVPRLEENNEDCVSFIDGLISCDADIPGVIHQQHRHTKSCQRSTKKGMICRFHIPYPPMQSTQVMTPYAIDFPASKRRKGCETLSKIKLYLEEHRKSLPDLEFQSFLDIFDLTEKEYLDAVRCSIQRPTVFLKRNVRSVFTNACIPTLAKVWRSNMDVQPIVDPFAVARYVASYMTKSTGGISKLMMETAEQIKNGNYSLKEKMRKMANQFLNCVEISAPEAAYGVLSIPLTKSSRDCIFINTGPPEERVRFLKSNTELQKLDPESTDVTATGVLDYYENRPDELESFSLAEFAAMFSFSSKNKWTKSDDQDDESGAIEEEEGQEGLHEQKTFKVKNNLGYLRKRKFPKIIRFRRYGEKEEPQQYYRECLMLYLPWRNELDELITINHTEKFKENSESIMKVKKLFNTLETESLEAMKFDDEDCIEADVDDEFDVFDDFRQQADILNEMIGEPNQDNNADRIPVPDLLSDIEYEELIRTLNQKQKMYACHLLNSLMNEKVVLEFVYGGAGVGKSKLIEAIVQSSVRLLNLKFRKTDNDLSSCKVLVGAPTGMAAFNIKGSTLHSLFMLPLNQFRGGLPKLSDDKRNTISCALRDCKLLIIDEISMVSNDQLYQISTRLQQIYNNNLHFGGLSVVLFGDLRQLKPVCASTVFSSLKTDFGEVVGNPIWEQFRSFELDEIMRQKDDKTFAEALNRLSKGAMTEEDVKLFQSREISKCDLPKTKCIRLFKDNKSVSKYNEEALNEIQEESTISTAIDACQGRGKPEWKKSLLESVTDLSTAEAMGLPGKLHMVVTAKYMVTNNLDTSDGLVNGSLGTLRKISYGLNSEKIKRPTIAWLHFKEMNVGKKRCKEKRALLKKESVQGWVPIQLEKKTIKTWPGRDLKCIRMQFPMVPAEGMTIHKCQGSTHDEIVLDINGVSRQALYVGCSRARTLQGLFIIGNFKAPVCLPNDPIEAEMVRVKEREISIEMALDAENYIFNLTRSTLGSVERQKKPPVFQQKISVQAEPMPLESLVRPLVININSVAVYPLDLLTLKPGEWLSDAVIDGFLGLIMQTSTRKTVHNFGSFFYLYLQNNTLENTLRSDYTSETSRDILVFPVCIDFHWRVVIAKKITKTVRCLNSLQRDKHDKTVEQVVTQFLNCVQSKIHPDSTPWVIDLSHSPTPKQDNSYDCGIFVCKYVEMVANDEEISFCKDDLFGYRNYVHDCIVNQKVNVK